MRLPTGTEPVSDTLRTMGEAISVSEISAGFAGQDAERAWRQPGIDQRLADGKAGAGRLGGGAGDDRAAGRQRRRDLARRQQGREVPRRERERRRRPAGRSRSAARRRCGREWSGRRCAWPPRRTTRTGRRRPVVSPRASASGLPVSVLIMPGDVVDALADQLGGPAQDRGALPGRHLAPGLEAALAALASAASMSLAVGRGDARRPSAP